MTITTAKGIPARIAARVPRLAPLAAALLVALPAQAQWKVTPSLSLTETYSDNPGLASSEANKQGQFITEAIPAIRVSGHNSRIDFNADARSSYFRYSDGKPANARSNDYQYSAGGRLKVIDEFMYVDARTNGGTRTISAFGPDNSGNRYSGENRTQVNNWTISPFLVQRFGNFAAATLRYTHDSVNAEETRFGSSDSDSINFNLSSGRAWRDLGWNMRYVRQEVSTDSFGDSSSENALLGLSYRLQRTLSLTASAGYDVYDYGDFGGRTSGASWSAGFAWRPTTRTAIEMSVGRHFLGNTGSLLATHRSRHTVWRASYSDAVTSTRQEFTQGQVIDTAALLDSLFAVSIPDPVARRQAVLDYIQLAGLPPTQGEQINYLTNRYFRQKLAQASAGYNMRRHGAVLTLFASERVALSSGAADSELLGNQQFALNDNVRQVGVNASYSYRANARTSASATLSASRSRSLTTDIESDQQALRLGMTRRFSRNLSGSAELRRLRGNRGFGADYTENAISATLSAQF